MIFSSAKGLREELRSTAILSAWRDILHQRFPLSGSLSPEDQQQLEGHIQMFLAQEGFDGCDGLAITDETWGNKV
jgi:MtfA peptidase